MLATDRLPLSEPRAPYLVPTESTPALVAVDDPDQEPVALHPGPTLLGSGQGAQVRLIDRFVSRQHARIVRTSAGLLLEDLGSTNGTHVRGRPVTRSRLASGDVLAVGRARLAVVIRHAGRVPAYEFGDWIGAGPEGLARLRALLVAADLDAPVLLTGPTGAGKEVAAAVLHGGSARRGHPFVPLNCATIEPGLADAELFGHRPGAFTDARTDRPGAFLAAGAGTLFLDEIAEVATPVQAKLLRALERREVRRLGEDHASPVACRVVAATHANLADRVREGRFRADLLHRLSALLITVPPLRERPWDAVAIAHRQARRERFELRADADQVLLGHSWPGNVRELLHTLVRARLAAGAGPVTGAHVIQAIARGGEPHKGRLSPDHPRFEAMLEDALEAHGSLRRALAALGLARSTYYDWRARQAAARRAS